MDIAIAQVAEENHPHAREPLGQRLHLAEKSGDHAGRHRHVELVGEPAPAHRLGRGLAHLPDRPCLGLGTRDHSVGDQPVGEQALEPGCEGFARRLACGGLLFDHDKARVLARERDAKLGVRLADIGHSRPVDELERREAGEARPRRLQQGRQEVAACQACERGLKRLRRRLHLQHGAGDDAERAFRADEDLFQVDAGVVLLEDVEAAHHGAVGEHDFEAAHLLAHVAVAEHLHPAGIGGDHAADLA